MENNPDLNENQASFDEQSDFADAQRGQTEDYYFDGQRQVQEKDSVFSFFKKLLTITDSTKVANLDKRELGSPELSVRNCQRLAYLGDIMHNEAFNSYFMKQGEITLATSMAKKGWLPELVVSQKRFNTRSVQAQPAQQKSFLGGIVKSDKPNEQQPQQ